MVTAVCLILGLAAATVGLALSAGFASAPFLDPILPGGPLVFLAGLFVMVLAAVAYELIPDREVRGGSKTHPFQGGGGKPNPCLSPEGERPPMSASAGEGLPASSG
jgi:hypothetical protein